MNIPMERHIKNIPTKLAYKHDREQQQQQLHSIWETTRRIER